MVVGTNVARQIGARTATVALLAGAIACSTPTGPSVSIGAAKAVLPAAGSVIGTTSQPLTLTVQNATTSQPSVPVTDTFEVATDPAFVYIVLTKILPQSVGEQTSVTLDSLPPSIYYWRVRAAAGGAVVTSAAATFRIAPVLQAPVLALPANGVLIGYQDQPVTLAVQNPAMPPTVTIITDTFEVATDAAFTTVVSRRAVPQGPGAQTSVALSPLAGSAMYYWRVRATATDAMGATSATATFQIGPSILSVNGTVTDGTSGGILPNISMQITNGANAGKSVTTDGSGNYTFRGLSPGSFILSASNEAYVTVAKSVSLSANTRVDFVLQRAPPPTFSVNGTVIGTAGDTLRYVTVQISDGTNAGHFTYTDIQGNYTIGGLLPGMLTVSAGGKGYVTAAKSVSLAANTRVDFVLAPMTTCFYDYYDIGSDAYHVWNVSAGATLRQVSVFTNLRNCAWSAYQDPSSLSWISITPTAGMQSDTISINIQQNTTGAARSAVIHMSPCPTESFPLCGHDGDFLINQSK
jgi:hypothetical protein